MSAGHERLHALVRGRVQGVSFRFYTVEEARRLGLQGWVRNLRDGDVEVLAEGPRTGLEALLAFLHRGPRAARVAEVRSDWSTAQGDLGPFNVRG